jgi:hypothetical protein
MWDMGYRYGIWANDMGDDSIDMVISHIDIRDIDIRDISSLWIRVPTPIVIYATNVVATSRTRGLHRHARTAVL